MINGAYNDNLFAQPQNLFIEDAIEETQILTSGISAGTAGSPAASSTRSRRAREHLLRQGGSTSEPVLTTETPFEECVDRASWCTSHRHPGHAPGHEGRSVVPSFWTAVVLCRRYASVIVRHIEKGSLLPTTVQTWEISTARSETTTPPGVHERPAHPDEQHRETSGHRQEQQVIGGRELLQLRELSRSPGPMRSLNCSFPSGDQDELGGGKDILDSPFVGRCYCTS
jgi:hypothetical protein